MVGPPAPYPAPGPYAAPGPYPFGEPLLPPPPSAPRRRWGRILLPAGLALVLVILVGVSIGLTNSPSKKPTGSHAAASPSPSPTGPPLTPEQYQAALDTFSKTLGNSLANLPGARTPPEVRQVLTAFQTALTSATYPLKTLFPPDAVRSAHQTLVVQLDVLNGLIVDTESATNTRAICAGSSALTNIVGTSTAEMIRTAIQGLSTADPAHQYKLAPFLPASAPAMNRQLNNGNLIKKPGRCRSPRPTRRRPPS
ncbi:MAG: hypothetical protein AUG44_27200 [Actinobacteria bacterium 13_1_20CM_3_71_11]|nr:MAG: hypothetical protein AUG44_27200 [Actinobacteria bacterium 13_1_20CM_3_71_11]